MCLHCLSTFHHWTSTTPPIPLPSHTHTHSLAQSMPHLLILSLNSAHYSVCIRNTHYTGSYQSIVSNTLRSLLRKSDSPRRWEMLCVVASQKVICSYTVVLKQISHMSIPIIRKTLLKLSVYFATENMMKKFP